MSAKTLPPYVPHITGETAALMGVEGTLGTSDTSGTARVLPIGMNPTTGALYVQDLAGASGTSNVSVVNGTMTEVSNLAKGTITRVEGGTVGLITRVGNVGTLELGSVVMNSGTVNALASGTITGGTLQNLVSGTLNALAAGTITGGTLQNLNNGTLAQVTSVSNLAAGTSQVNKTPVQLGTSFHTRGTTGAAVWGTLIAAAGAGTKQYVSNVDVVVTSGTVDVAVTNIGVGGSTGAGVLARGQFPAGGGIAKQFDPVNPSGANGTLAFWMGGAGTVDITINYWQGV